MKTEQRVETIEKRLEEYTPPPFLIERTDLVFRVFETDCEVVSKTIWKRQGSDTSLILDGSEFFELLSIKLEGRELSPDEYQQGSATLTIKKVPERFSLEIATKLSPKDNTRLEGLYLSGGMLCTQCEAEGFRHITYFLDRPDVLSIYDVRIEADQKQYPVLLSNGNKGESGTLAGGRHYACWHDPYPKPCYLFALVAGNLLARHDSFKTKEEKNIELNIYVRPDDIEKTAFAIDALKKAMSWEEERFGLCYDLDIYNIVAVSDFNMGAMENKGLNIFNTKYVLATTETATDTDFENIEGIIGHEYFHNWTGNRITCRDWFQLSLKEGLTVFRDQEFSSDVGNRAIKRIQDVKILRTHQFSEDAGPLAHPVRPESYIEINNFYTSTVYNKGAEVIRMMHLMLGEERFQEGMRLYIHRFDGMAVTCEDFICCMEDASGISLEQFRLWYSQAGTPVVKASKERKGDDVIIRLEQSCPATPGQQQKKPMVIPFLYKWLDKEGKPLDIKAEDQECSGSGDATLLLLREGHQKLVFRDVPKDAVPSFLQGFSAPIVLHDDNTVAERAHIAKHDTDEFSRWEAFQKIMTDYILAEVSGTKDDETRLKISEIYRSALENCWDNPAFTAEIITLPNVLDMGQKMALFDPVALHAAREKLVNHLAVSHQSLIEGVYIQTLAPGKSSTQLLEQRAKRRLACTLLFYLARIQQGQSLIREHYERATNMTDRLAAFSLVCDSSFDYRTELIDQFYQDWQDDPLVVDKWFAAQAVSVREDTLMIVRNLSCHSAFSYKNPNRLRALISSFSVLNPVSFHGNGEAGYRFLADTIVATDAFNPQTAARLIAPLGRWQSMPEKNADAMQKTLEHILESPTTSSDVRELAQKSLA